MSQIVNYLNSPKNSRIREAIFKYALFHDLKLAAANHKVNLKIYEPEVDNEGADIIMEGVADFSRKIQLKTIYHSTTPHWSIHKRLLLPPLNQAEDYCIEDTFVNQFPGAVILTNGREPEPSSKHNHAGDYPQNEYEYYYSDINIIYLKALGFFQRRNSGEVAAKGVFEQIRNSSYVGKIELPRSLFVKTKGPDGLLALLGVVGNYDFVNFSHRYIRANLNPKSFFISLPNYYPYEQSKEVLDTWHKALDVEIKESTMMLNSIFKKHLYL